VFAVRRDKTSRFLTVGGIGASALVGPFALSLFWRKASQTGFVTGVVVSQLVTAFLLLASYDILVTSPTLKLWEIMAIGHLVSTGLTGVISLATPDAFDFSAIAQEPAVADGGEEVQTADNAPASGGDAE
jgi:Na+/proline symporter